MRILVGITGGVAAYKAAELIREFVEDGHEVRAIPTANALRFIGAATLEALTHNSVHSDLYSDIEDVRHIEMAKWAELVVVAPATASFIARTSSGIADDLLGNVILATTAKIVVAPAMHTEMWLNAATVQNVRTLRSRGISVIEPDSGRLTGADSGVGRLPEPKRIASESLASLFNSDLVGKKILVIAGGTQEPIDPVRFIGNRSSGKQGIALVEASVARGAQVTLIAANFQFSRVGVEVREICTTTDLANELAQTKLDFDLIFMPAAVSDYSFSHPSDHKLKKKELGASFNLELVQNPDIIAGLSQRILNEGLPTKLVGFAAETAGEVELEALARDKLRSKRLKYIVVNDVSGGKGFDRDENSVILVTETQAKRITGSKLYISNELLTALS